MGPAPPPPRGTHAPAAAAAGPPAAGAPTTPAAVVYSGPVSIAVPNTFAGVYLNLVTGTTSTTPTTGYDINPYSSSSSLSFFFPTGSGGLSQDGTNLAVLSAFSYIGPLTTFVTSIPADPAFRAGETGGYLGLEFLNETTGATDYGWLRLNTTGTTGFPATITGYAYENTGAAIFAGAVPEPGTNAALALGALSLGAAGVRRWRQSKQAVA